MADAERNRLKIQALASKPENRQCVDCGFAPVTWCSLNLGVWFCIHCSAIHRQLGTSISQVRSISLDKFTSEQVWQMSQTNNIQFNQSWEAKLHKEWQQFNQQNGAAHQAELQRQPQGRRTIGAATSSRTKPQTTAANSTLLLSPLISDNSVKPGPLATDNQRLKFIFDKYKFQKYYDAAGPAAAAAAAAAAAGAESQPNNTQQLISQTVSSPQEQVATPTTGAKKVSFGSKVKRITPVTNATANVNVIPETTQISNASATSAQSSFDLFDGFLAPTTVSSPSPVQPNISTQPLSTLSAASTPVASQSSAHPTKKAFSFTRKNAGTTPSTVSQGAVSSASPRIGDLSPGVSSSSVFLPSNNLMDSVLRNLEDHPQQIVHDPLSSPPVSIPAGSFTLEEFANGEDIAPATGSNQVLDIFSGSEQQQQPQQAPPQQPQQQLQPQPQQQTAKKKISFGKVVRPLQSASLPSTPAETPTPVQTSNNVFGLLDNFDSLVQEAVPDDQTSDNEQAFGFLGDCDDNAEDSNDDPFADLVQTPVIEGEIPLIAPEQCDPVPQESPETAVLEPNQPIELDLNVPVALDSDLQQEDQEQQQPQTDLIADDDSDSGFAFLQGDDDDHDADDDDVQEETDKTNPFGFSTDLEAPTHHNNHDDDDIFGHITINTPEPLVSSLPSSNHSNNTSDNDKIISNNVFESIEEDTTIHQYTNLDDADHVDAGDDDDDDDAIFTFTNDEVDETPVDSSQLFFDPSSIENIPEVSHSVTTAAAVAQPPSSSMRTVFTSEAQDAGDDLVDETEQFNDDDSLWNGGLFAD